MIGSRMAGPTASGGSNRAIVVQTEPSVGSGAAGAGRAAASRITALPEVTRVQCEDVDTVYRVDDRHMMYDGRRVLFPQLPSIGMPSLPADHGISRYLSDAVPPAEVEQVSSSLRTRAEIVASRLEFSSCLDEGFDCAVFNLSRVEEALKEHGKRKSQLPFKTRRSLLSWEKVPSFTCSSSSQLFWVLRDGTVRAMTLRERLGVMLPPYHGVTRALLRHASRSSTGFVEALRAGSQGVQYDLARLVVRRGIELAGFRDELLSCSANFSGVSTFEVALSLERPMDFVVKWVADDTPAHHRIHSDSGWPSDGEIRYHLDAESDDVALEERTDIHFHGQPCAWLSSARRADREGSEPAPFDWGCIYENVTQFRRSLRYVATARPRLVFIETVSRLYDKPKHLARMKFEDSLRSIVGYKWRSQIMSPNTHADVPCHRERLFWIGVLDSSLW